MVNQTFIYCPHIIHILRYEIPIYDSSGTRIQDEQDSCQIIIMTKLINIESSSFKIEKQ